MVVRAAAVGTRRDKKIVLSMFGPASSQALAGRAADLPLAARQIAAMDEDEAFAGCARPIQTGEAPPASTAWREARRLRSVADGPWPAGGKKRGGISRNRGGGHKSP